MNNILAIETSSEACSAALSVNGVVYERSQHAPRQQSSLILPMVEAVLDDAGLSRSDVDAIGFGRGPGAFTGVRIATGIAQGMGYALDCPVVPVSSLQALAASVEGAALVATDARMGEIYCGMFDAQNQLIGEEHVLKPSDWALPESGDWVLVGDGWSAYETDLMPNVSHLSVKASGDDFPQARAVLALTLEALERGEGVPAEQALPVYLRDNVAQKSKKPLIG